MLCNRCGKESAVHRVTGKDGTNRYLCEGCYRALKDGKVKVCPQCGTSLSQFLNTGLVGCAHCYEAFGEEIWNYLSRAQRGRIDGDEARLTRMRALAREYDKTKAACENASRECRFEEAKALERRLEELQRKLYPTEETR